MEGSLTPPFVTLVLGIVTAVLAFLAPIALALINRGGQAKTDGAHKPPDVDLIADLDEANDRLTAEVRRKDREISRLLARLDREGTP